MNTKEIAAKLNWAMQAVPLAKELSWSEKDFDKATLARIKKYRDKQGL